MPDAAISCTNRFVVGGGVLDAPKAFSLRRRCRGCAATDEVLAVRKNPLPEPGRGTKLSKNNAIAVASRTFLEIYKAGVNQSEAITLETLGAVIICFVVVF